MNQPNEIRTSRLLLRQWRETDKTPFYALNSDPQVMTYFPAQLSREQSDAVADRVQAWIAEKGWGFWAVEELASGEFTGFVGLNLPPEELPCYPSIEIGWRLAQHFWGRGYATEAATAALKYGFETLVLDDIVSFTALGNQRSRAVMERLGMINTQQDFDHPHVDEKSGLRRHCLYRLTHERFASL